MQPLLRLIAQQPELLVEHAKAYAELIGAQTGQACAVWKRQALLGAIGIGLLGVGAVLAGVALMLWAMLPVTTPAAWVLVAVPLLPSIVALGCLAAARRHGDGDAFAGLREQLQADLSMLHESSTS